MSGQDRGTARFVLLPLLPQSGAPAFVIGPLMSLPPSPWLLYPDAHTNKGRWQKASLPTITSCLDLEPNNSGSPVPRGRIEPRTWHCDLMGDRV